MLKVTKLVAATAIAIAGIGSAAAADITCVTTTNEHMSVSDTYVSSCLAGGTGNINGNGQDPFLNGAGSEYTFLSKSGGSNPYDITWTSVDNPGGLGSTGTFAFDSSVWADYSDVAIGFKFGTGNEADEWFVYALNDNVSSGLWSFIENTTAGGSGLSHINLYGIAGVTPPSDVPEPMSLALFGMGFLGIGFALKRRKQ